MIRALLGVAALVLIAPTAPAQTGRAAGKFGLHTGYEAAKAEARRTGRPIFLVFRCEP